MSTTPLQVVKCHPRAELDVQAVLVTDDNVDAVAAWCGGKVIGRDIDRPEIELLGEPDNYGMRETAWPGQYVIRGRSGDYFPTETWLFERDYEVTG